MGWGWDGMDGPVVDVSQSSSRQVEVEMAERRRRITYSLDRRGAGGYLGKTWTGRPKLTASERHKGRASESETEAWKEREKERDREKKKEEKDTGAKWGFEWMNGSDRSGGCKYNSHSK